MRLLLVEDEHLLRELQRVRLLQEWPDAVIGEAESAARAMALLDSETWDIVILDVRLPGRDGFSVIEFCRSLKPEPPVLVLSSHAEEQYAVRAITAGAKGYLTKSATAAAFIEAIRTIVAGHTFMTLATASLLASSVAQGKATAAPPHTKLTNREYEVLVRLGAGYSVTKVAEGLSLSVKTVSTHRANILSKLGLETSAQLVRYVLENGLR